MKSNGRAVDDQRDCTRIKEDVHPRVGADGEISIVISIDRDAGHRVVAIRSG